jgi:hypothetical protein
MHENYSCPELYTANTFAQILNDEIELLQSLKDILSRPNSRWYDLYTEVSDFIQAKTKYRRSPTDYSIYVQLTDETPEQRRIRLENIEYTDLIRIRSLLPQMLRVNTQTLTEEVEQQLVRTQARRAEYFTVRLEKIQEKISPSNTPAVSQRLTSLQTDIPHLQRNIDQKINDHKNEIKTSISQMIQIEESRWNQMNQIIEETYTEWVHREGRNELTERLHREDTERIEQREQAARRAAAARPLGVAFEVHDFFYKIPTNLLIDFLKRKIKIPLYTTPIPNDDPYNFFKNSVNDMFERSDLSSSLIADYKNATSLLFEHKLKHFDFDHYIPHTFVTYTELIRLVLNYVNEQPIIFQRFYITDLITQCTTAYSSGSTSMDNPLNFSCTQGVIERFVTSLMNATIELESNDDNEYQILRDLINFNVDRLLLQFREQWFTSQNTLKPLTPLDKRKPLYIEFLMQKFNVDNLNDDMASKVISSIQTEADTLEKYNQFEELIGGKRFSKNLKSVKNKKNNINKNGKLNSSKHKKNAKTRI